MKYTIPDEPQSRVTAARERELLERLLATERELAGILREGGHDLAEQPGRKPHRWRAAVDAKMAQVPGVTEAGRRARELHRRARRLLWRLALSGLPQVEHALHRASTRVPREALRQAGVMGLYRAACRFEPRRGLRLSTYCRYWVREAMQDLAGRLDHVTRLPASARRQLRADPRELSARQAQALDRVRRTVRFEAPTPGKGDQTWSDVIADPRPKPRPDVIIARRRRARRARHALDVAPLDARERDILAHRLELDGAPRQSFRELGARHEVSGERVRQVFNAALSRLEKALAGGQPRGEG